MKQKHLALMKAVIPVAGVGTRLRPHTYTQPKALIPVAGKPIIAFIMDELLEAGVTSFVFIIGYLGEKIRDYIHSEYPNLEVEFVEQHEREGLGHAIWTAREVLLSADEILIVLGDTIFDMNLAKMLECPNSWLGVKEVQDPREFGVVELEAPRPDHAIADRLVRRVIEKPKIPKSNLALVGLYKIREVKDLVEALAYNITHNIRSVGEFQLADGLQRMVDAGIQFSTVSVNNWFDCGKKEVLLDTNRMLLERSGIYNVDLPAFDNTIFVHPVSIGDGCDISNSIIGPYVSIGSHTRIEHSIIKESIIGSYTSLTDVVLHHSLIGSDSTLKGSTQSLNIGDNAELDLS
jgi:glucose-1-phosphate thymidylyltransferase